MKWTRYPDALNHSRAHTGKNGSKIGKKGKELLQEGQKIEPSLVDMPYIVVALKDAVSRLAARPTIGYWTDSKKMMRLTLSGTWPNDADDVRRASSEADRV